MHQLATKRLPSSLDRVEEEELVDAHKSLHVILKLGDFIVSLLKFAVQFDNLLF